MVPVRSVVVAAVPSDEGGWTLVRDWELMKLLNPLADKPRSVVFSDVHPANDTSNAMARARDYVVSQTDALAVPFEIPTVESLACLVPSEASADENTLSWTKSEFRALSSPTATPSTCTRRGLRYAELRYRLVHS